MLCVDGTQWIFKFPISWMSLRKKRNLDSLPFFTSAEELPLRRRKMMNVPIFCPIWMGSDELPAQKLGLTVSSIQNQEMSSPTASLLNNNFFTWSIGLLLFSVLIPEQALAPAPPPVQSANFITEVSPVRKTTQHLKSKSYFLKTITC